MPFLNPNTRELSRLGGKGAALARLGVLGFEIPAWFAVPGDAAWTRDELPRAVQNLGAGPFAVRSSGAAEDGAAHSFAGQFVSFLNVPAIDVSRRISDVRASAKSDAVLAYCTERGLPFPEKPAVLVQRMVDAHLAGVGFGADPVSGRRGVTVISAVAGLGEKLVSGDVDGETWEVGSDGEISVGPECGLMRDAEALAVAALVQRCGDACGQPQDVEWAIDQSGILWLLQSRPITTLSQTPDPGDTLCIWDNSNIAESYGGVTTPLTFSFARRIYESAYREFCKLMSVPRDRIERADDVFPRMLGLIRGRVYYNLCSWYRVLALLPGFQLNRSFMEQMMGVREPLPDEIVNVIVAENRSGRFADALASVRTCMGLVRQAMGLKKQIARFQIRFDAALAAPAVPLERMTGEQLVAHYRDLERQLLKKWDAPLVNDFFAMIYYGVLRTLCAKWLGDVTGGLQNELLLDGGDIISAEPPRQILKMAALAAGESGLAASLVDANISSNRKIAALGTKPELAEAFESYLTDFGDRCLEELKLESPTVRDDPASLLISIGAMALRTPMEPVEAVAKIPIKLPSHPLKRLVFNHVLRQARERVRCRENLRFERTRLFGRVRTIFRELGKRLRADGVLAKTDDVFYLEMAEIFAAWDGTGTTADLGTLAKQRRVEFDGYETVAAPPDRFETRGPLSRNVDLQTTSVTQISTSDLRGSGACPGHVIGRARVVLDPRQARIEPGEILVARQTDPGWVILFPAAAGLLVERGSLLSHSAIVSRELRLPCIVSVPGLTEIIKTGDLIEMDGAAGTIAILESQGASTFCRLSPADILSAGKLDAGQDVRGK